MRHGTGGRRSRNRGNGNRRGNNNRMQVFDSNGPDVRIRGTAHQIHEKYVALAKDANSSGDRILAESYLQHAEHYQRVINAWNENNADKAVDKSQDKAVKKPVSGNQKSHGDKDEDLGLPASILGESVTKEKDAALEDA